MLNVFVDRSTDMQLTPVCKLVQAIMAAQGFDVKDFSFQHASYSMITRLSGRARICHRNHIHFIRFRFNSQFSIIL